MRLKPFEGPGLISVARVADAVSRSSIASPVDRDLSLPVCLSVPMLGMGTPGVRHTHAFFMEFCDQRPEDFRTELFADGNIMEEVLVTAVLGEDPIKMFMTEMETFWLQTALRH